MGSVLRYWQVDDDAVAALFRSVQCDELMPVGAVCWMSGIGSMVFRIDEIRSLLAQSRTALRNHITVPEAAERLDVKQEVAYSLVRSGLMRSVESKVGRRAVRLVAVADLTGFLEQYIFARDVAGRCLTSPKAMVAVLAEERVMPVAGPHVDGCRQVVYRRADVTSFLAKIEAGLPRPST
jgi:hypothetical protein